MKYTVKKGTKYQAEIKLGFLEKIASNETIQKKFLEAGFVNVQVTGEGKSRTAVGEWIAPDATADMPSQVALVKIV
jgi:hypothetical protein